MIFLHQNCTTRLRSVGRASAKYSMRGEPVTFLVVLRGFGALQHHWEIVVKPATKQPRGPVFTRFSHLRTAHRKITAAFLRFVHACCIRNGMDYKRTTGSGCLKPHKNSGRVARWRFKCFARDSFLPMLKAKKTARKLSVRLRRYCEFATSTKPSATAS